MGDEIGVFGELSVGVLLGALIMPINEQGEMFRKIQIAFIRRTEAQLYDLIQEPLVIANYQLKHASDYFDPSVDQGLKEVSNMFLRRYKNHRNRP